jgi:hypothetical protein
VSSDFWPTSEVAYFHPRRHQASHMKQISLVGAPVVKGNEMVNPLPEKMTFLLAQVHFV